MSGRDVDSLVRTLRVEGLVRLRVRDEAATANADARATFEEADAVLSRARAALERAKSAAVAHTPCAARFDHRTAASHRLEAAGLSQSVVQAEVRLRGAVAARRSARTACRAAADALAESERQLRSIQRAVERAEQRATHRRLRAEESRADDTPQRASGTFVAKS